MLQLWRIILYNTCVKFYGADNSQRHSRYNNIDVKERMCALQWRHDDHGGVSNNQAHDCLLNRLFRRRSKKTSKLRVTGLCAGNSPVTDQFPAQGPVTRKMFPFDDVIMAYIIASCYGNVFRAIGSLWMESPV